MTTMSNTRIAALQLAMRGPRPTAPRAAFPLWRTQWAIQEFFWKAWLVVR